MAGKAIETVANNWHVSILSWSRCLDVKAVQNTRGCRSGSLFSLAIMIRVEADASDKVEMRIINSDQDGRAGRS